VKGGGGAVFSVHVPRPARVLSKDASSDICPRTKVRIASVGTKVRIASGWGMEAVLMIRRL
jgi:hypothetical protein